MIHFLKKYFLNEYVVLLGIFVLAYLIRVAPYLFGYTLPFAEEGMRDFGLVKYIIDNNSIHFFNSFFDYGAFPTLHLLVAGVAKLFALDPLRVFLFLPQVFSSLGIVIFFFFLRKQFSVKTSLLAVFLISVFTPHIYWTGQPVRESIGLFFFPLIIYLFDREFKTSGTVWGRVMLISAMMAIIPTHHWSTIMTIGWVSFYSYFTLRSSKRLLEAFFITGITSFFALGYWAVFFRRGLDLIASSLTIPLFILFIILAALIIKRKRYDKVLLDLNIFKSRPGKIIGVFIVILALVLVSFGLLPVNYPLQVWLSLLIFMTLILAGFYLTFDQKVNNLILISTIYLIPWVLIIPFIIVGTTLKDMPVDPFRTLEFIIFPLSVVGAIGLQKLPRLFFSKVVLILALIFLSTSAYPSIYIFKTSFAYTPFYDIRSDIRHISPAIRELIAWANEHNYSVASPIIEVQAYQEVFYPNHSDNTEKIMLSTISNERVSKNFSYINDPIVGVSLESHYGDIVLSDNLIALYSNAEGGLYLPPFLGAEFIDQSLPERVLLNQEFTAWIRMKNISNITWQKDAGFLLYDQDQRLFIDLPHDVLPGETVDFILEDKVDDPAKFIGEYIPKARMYKKGLGFFGESAPAVSVKLGY